MRRRPPGRGRSASDAGLLLDLGTDDSLGIRKDLFRCALHVVDLLAMLQNGRDDHGLGADDFPATCTPDAKLLTVRRRRHDTSSFGLVT
jgi:hypothetical protein